VLLFGSRQVLSEQLLKPVGQHGHPVFLSFSIPHYDHVRFRARTKR
jgi:hypothetical protein